MIWSSGRGRNPRRLLNGAGRASGLGTRPSRRRPWGGSSSLRCFFTGNTSSIGLRLGLKLSLSPDFLGLLLLPLRHLLLAISGLLFGLFARLAIPPLPHDIRGRPDATGWVGVDRDGALRGAGSSMLGLFRTSEAN